LLLLFILELGWGASHLLLLDDVTLLEFLKAQLHHLFLEVSVLKDVFFAVVRVTHQVRSQFV